MVERRVRARAPHAGQQAHRAGHGARAADSTRTRCTARCPRRTSPRRWRAPAVGAARGFLAAFEERLRSKSSAVDDGLTVNMARYAQAVAQVDAVHAVSLQNAQRLRCVPAREVSPRQTRQVPARPGVRGADGSQGGQLCCTRSAAAAACTSSSDLQRLWRDTTAASAHHGLTWDWTRWRGPRAILGLPTPPGLRLYAE